MSLEQLFEVAGLGLHLVEQSCIFDCDDGLVGEGLDELDLFVVEGAGSVRSSEITPIGSPIRNKGMPRHVRNSPVFAYSLSAYSGSASTSSI